MWSRRTRMLGIVTLTLAVAVGCDAGPQSPAPATDSTPSAVPSASTSPSPSPSAAATFDSYVSIGDSFTSGPGLARLRDDSGFCLRSDRNWPSLLAPKVAAGRFDDVSCAGATTADVVASRTIPGQVVPPQLDAVTSTTDLVTVGIGGNDGGLFTSLLSACARDGARCRSFTTDAVPGILQSTTQRVATVLRRILSNAPDARIVLVGYLRILPTAGSCATLPVSPSDARDGAQVEGAIDRALAQAAKEADVTYVSMRDASEGHDACAGADAWTNGARVTDDDGIGFHPRHAGMEAVADQVAAALAE